LRSQTNSLTQRWVIELDSSSGSNLPSFFSQCTGSLNN